MRTRANFRSHPIHAMLIPLPIGLLAGAVIFDVGGTILGLEAWWRVGYHLAIAGVLAGLIAAVPGLVDYLSSVPPRSSAKRRGLKHALANVTALLLFAAAWWLRGDAGVSPDLPLLGLEVLGAAFLTMGGWMGGTLVYRNFIGPDHRYARAGRWSEERAPDDGAPNGVRVADVGELEVDQMKLVHVDGRRIVLARTEDGHVAFDDHCSHRGGSLAGGVLMCGTVQCLWHGSQFDLRDGSVRAGPAEKGIATYRVEEGDGGVRLFLD